MDPDSLYRKTLAGYCREFAVTVFDWPEFEGENALMRGLTDEIMMSGSVERALAVKLGEAVARYSAKVSALYSRDPYNSFLGMLNQRVMNLQDLIRTHLAGSSGA